jgi:hypothetical protein
VPGTEIGAMLSSFELEVDWLPKVAGKFLRSIGTGELMAVPVLLAFAFRRIYSSRVVVQYSIRSVRVSENLSFLSSENHDVKF